MSEQVVIGQLKEPFHIKPESPFRGSQAQPVEWDHRAMWSWARLQYKRTIADAKIKEYFDMITTMKGRALTKEERRNQMGLLFADLVRDQDKPPRMMQFILDSEGKVMAVASLKHLLIPPAEVYALAKRILSKNYGKPKLERISQLSGLTYEVKQKAGFTLGLQVFGGCITTRQAITMTSWLRVKMCLNPLSWLGVGGFGSMGVVGGTGFERVLRIKVTKDFEPRFREAIEQTIGNLSSIEKRVRKAQRIKVDPEEARIVASALGLSYSLGAKTIKQIIERLPKEKPSLWGLSMSASWVAAHGKFKKTPKHQERVVEQTLSTIAGAAILIDNIKVAKQKSLEWLKSHVKQGKIKSLDELIGDLL